MMMTFRKNNNPDLRDKKGKIWHFHYLTKCYGTLGIFHTFTPWPDLLVHVQHDVDEAAAAAKCVLQCWERETFVWPRANSRGRRTYKMASFFLIFPDFFSRNQVRLWGLWLHRRRQGRCLLHRRLGPRLQLEPHHEDHRGDRRPEGEGQEEYHHVRPLPNLLPGQELQGHRWHPRFRGDLEVVRQERWQDHALQGSLQVVVHPR